MRILYLSQYFPPEIGATQNRAYEMAHQWVKMGHSVTMLAEFPNHPSGIMPAEYHGKIIEKRNLNGITVIRVWVKTSPKKTFQNRMIFYFSYMVLAILVGLFTPGKFDFIYATSPPLFVGAAALVLSWIKRTPMVFEVRDLWPESAIVMGELSNPRSIALSKKLEELCYQKARFIIVVTKGVYEQLQIRGIQTDKLLLIPNGANIELMTYNSSKREDIRRELNLDNKFIAIYAGIHGIAQNLETIIEAARLLHAQDDIHFLFIGEGPKKRDLTNLVATYGLKNLTFLPEIPREEISSYLSAADVAIIPLRKNEVFKSAIPSKLYDAWACERPVILGIDGEARELVESINGGIYVTPEIPAQLAEGITKMKNYYSDYEEMGRNGRDFIVKNHSRQILAENLINRLEKSFHN